MNKNLECPNGCTNAKTGLPTRHEPSTVCLVNQSAVRSGGSNGGSSVMRMILAEQRKAAKSPEWSKDPKILGVNKRRGHSLVPKNLTDIPGLYGTDELPLVDKTVYAKYFTASADWYVFEMDQATGECFGLADLGMGHPEMGYFHLAELAGTVARGSNGMDTIVEQDLHHEPSRFGDTMCEHNRPKDNCSYCSMEG